MGMKKKILAAGLAAVGTGGMAQLPVDGSHYPAGLNGIKGGTLPGPGIYLRDDNWFYAGSGGALSDYKTFEYLQAPQLMWMTDWKILGASLGMDIELPIIYRQASYSALIVTPNGGFTLLSTINEDRFGLGDIKLEPLLLSWHWKHFDTTLGYALWVPSGKYSAGSNINLGDDQWSHMLTLGGVWYPDEKKTWAISLLHHLEFNSVQVGFVENNPNSSQSTGPRYENFPCVTYTLEYGVSKTVLTNIDVGVSGYYQKQFTDSRAAAATFNNSEVAGIGPEISASIPDWGVTASLRYAYEFTAYHRPQGHTVNLTLTKMF